MIYTASKRQDVRCAHPTSIGRCSVTRRERIRGQQGARDAADGRALRRKVEREIERAEAGSPAVAEQTPYVIADVQQRVNTITGPGGCIRIGTARRRDDGV